MQPVKFSIIAATALALMAAGCSNSNQIKSQTKTQLKMEQKDLKANAVNAQEAFFKDYSEEGIRNYFSETYIQHNPGVPTGIAPVIGFLPVLKEKGVTYKTHRLLQDGDFTIMHNTYNNAEVFGAAKVVTFDVWRWENGKVAEHWDAINPVVEKTASGRTQFDGPTEIIDKEKTQANKDFVTSFVNDILFGKNPGKIKDYISAEQYDQHNPAVKDGLDGLQQAIAYLTSQNNMFAYKKLHKVLGEGNFVLTMSDGEWNGKPQVFYDLFRVNNNKIVEHWDVIQEIPSKAANSNGMF